jgi:hypothetical protein
MTGLEISGIIVSLPPGAADLPKIIGDEIDGLIPVSWYDRGRPTGSMRTQPRHNLSPEEFGSDWRRRVTKGLPVNASQSSGDTLSGI